MTDHGEAPIAAPEAPPASASIPLATPLHPARVTQFLIALLLIVFAGHLFHEGRLFLPQPSAETLNFLFRIDLPNFENAISASLLLMVASVLLWRAFAPPVAPTRAALRASDAPIAAEGQRPALLAFLRAQWGGLAAAGALFAVVIAGVANAQRWDSLFVFWLMAWLLLIVIFRAYDRAAGIPPAPPLRRIDLAWLILIIGLGILTTTYQIDRLPNSIIGDEGNFFERAIAIARGLEQAPLFSPGVYSYPLLSSYFQALFISLFGETLFAWRIASAAAALLVVIPLYLLARDAFGRRMAVIACLVYITLPYTIAYARMGYNNSQSILPVMLTVYWLYHALRRRSLYYAALAGVAGGFGFYTYTAGRLGMVLGVATFGVLFLTQIGVILARRRRPDERRAARADAGWLVALGIVFVVVGLVVLLPNIVYTNTVSPNLLTYKTFEALFPNSNYALSLFQPGDLYRDYPPITIGTETLFFRADLWIELLVRGFVRTALSFHHPILNQQLYMVGGLVATVAVSFYVVGLVLLARRLRHPVYVMIGLWWLLALILLSAINTFPPRHQHMIPIVPALALLVALGIEVIVQFAVARLDPPPAAHDPIRKRPRLRRTLATLAVTVPLLGLIAFDGLKLYYRDMPAYYTPMFEDVIAFDALALEEPQMFLYAHSEPGRGGWTPWVIRFMKTPATYDTILAQLLSSGGVALTPGLRYSLYVEPQDSAFADEFLAMLDVPFTQERREDRGGRVVALRYDFSAPAAGS